MKQTNEKAPFNMQYCNATAENIVKITESKKE